MCVRREAQGYHGICLFCIYIHAKGEGDRWATHGTFLFFFLIQILHHLASSLDFGPMWTLDVPGVFSGEFKLPDLI